MATNEKLCESCGKALKEGAKFCNACGSSQQDTERRCQSCGKTLAANAKFCNACGAPQQSSSAAVSTAPEAAAPRSETAVLAEAVGVKLNITCQRYTNHKQEEWCCRRADSSEAFNFELSRSREADWGAYNVCC